MPPMSPSDNVTVPSPLSVTIISSCVPAMKAERSAEASVPPDVVPTNREGNKPVMEAAENTGLALVFSFASSCRIACATEFQSPGTICEMSRAITST